MDRLRPGVERREAAAGAGIAALRDPPEGAGLAVEVLAAEADRAGDRGIGATPPIVGIPTLGRRGPGLGIDPGAELAEVGEPAPARLGPDQYLEGIGFPHHLAERLAAL